MLSGIVPSDINFGRTTNAIASVSPVAGYGFGFAYHGLQIVHDTAVSTGQAALGAVMYYTDPHIQTQVNKQILAAIADAAANPQVVQGAIRHSTLGWIHRMHNDLVSGDPDRVTGAAAEVTNVASLALDAAFSVRALARFGEDLATGVSTDSRVTRVGRWMAPAEHEAMLETGMVQPNRTTVVHVSRPADPIPYMRQAPRGSRYVEFGVPDDALVPGYNNRLAQIPGPDSLRSRLAASRGRPPYSYPPAIDIRWIASKVRAQ